MSKTPLRRGSGHPSADVVDALHRAVWAHNVGNLAEAEALCNIVLTHDRKQFDALNMLGIIHAQRRNYTEAIRCIERALKVNPRSAEAHANLGRVQFAMGEPARAAASYVKALAIKPDFVLAHSNFAAVLRNLGRPQDALAHCDRALALQPDYLDAWNNRGNALFDLHRYDEALACHDKALTFAPGLAESWLGRGNACRALSRHDEAMSAYDRVLALNPGAAAAWIGRGYLAEVMRRFDEAFAAYDKAMSIDPTLKYIEGFRLHAKLHLCDWTNFDAECARLVANVNRGMPAALPFAVMGVASSAAVQLKCAQNFLKEKYSASSPPVCGGERKSHDRIRLAYLSADFHEHPVAALTIGLIEQHDKKLLELTGISLTPESSGEMQRRFKSAFERFIDVRHMNDLNVADLLRSLEVDILVDLTGHTADGRPGILSRRAVPVQVNYLGYPGTMGADFVDYIIADRYVIPEDHQGHYSEKVVYLPDTYQVNDSKRLYPTSAPRRGEAGLPERAFVFCSFNNVAKVTPPVFDIWMRLLRQVDDSVLWMLAENAATERNIRREALARGVAPTRIVFAPRVGYADYLARYRAADLFLDTLPFNGGTTVSDALWGGLPVVTCSGQAFASRMAGSLLGASGLAELATQSLDDYERLALALATDRPRLEAAKAMLAANRTTCALFDTNRFRRHIEAAYTIMYERHQRGEPPASFTVAALENA